MQLGGTRGRYYSRPLGKKPGPRGLSRGRLLPFSDLGEQIHKGLIRFPSLRCEAREGVAEVGTLERSAFVDLSREEPPAQRTESNQADAEFLEGRYDFLLRIPGPQRVFVLEGGDRENCVCATDRLDPGLGKTEPLYLPLLHEVFHRSRHIFDGYGRVNTVLIEQINDLELESLERAIGDFSNVLRPAVQTYPTQSAVGVRLEPELGDRKSTRLNS